MIVWIYLNDRFVKEDQAQVSVFDHGFLYGDGVYETIRSYGEKIFMRDQHLARLRRSADGIGLTIPTIAVASVWLDVPLHLGLDDTHIVLLALTVVVTVLTVVPGRATLLQAGVHLALLAAYLFLSASP